MRKFLWQDEKATKYYEEEEKQNQVREEQIIQFCL